eukprot:TRINITY_DN4479_c0_g1_i1.p1 TRINITY_DN4479_c0_g1~~TRINITY_DN4479_c0_g1_i1.p1  ORF type:complete len:511 (+),score=55.90 TRINITY_DN4479_c0_g1_i1:109-1533(+)
MALACGTAAQARSRIAARPGRVTSRAGSRDYDSVRVSRRRSSSLPSVCTQRGDELTVEIPHAVLAYSRTDLVVFYTVEVKLAGRSWRLSKRYSEFESLHRELLGLSLGGKLGLGFMQVFSNLPALPSKAVFQSTNQSRRLVEKRRRNLDVYLSAVVSRTRGSAAQHIVDFFLKPGHTSEDAVDERLAGDHEATHLHEGLTSISSEMGWVLPPVVGTFWSMGNPSALSGAGCLRTRSRTRILVCLPWAREDWSSSLGHYCRVKSVRGEHRQTVRARTLEFASVAEWLAESGDRVPSAQDVLTFIARRRRVCMPHPTSPRRLGARAGSHSLLGPEPHVFRCGTGEDMCCFVTPPPAAAPAGAAAAARGRPLAVPQLRTPQHCGATPPTGSRGECGPIYPHQCERPSALASVAAARLHQLCQGCVADGSDVDTIDSSDSSSSVAPTLPPSPAQSASAERPSVCRVADAAMQSVPYDS